MRNHGPPLPHPSLHNTNNAVIFINRLKYTFEGTKYSYSKCVFMTLNIMIAFYPILLLIILIVRIVSHHLPNTYQTRMSKKEIDDESDIEKNVNENGEKIILMKIPI